jgi:hypothetical protein
VEKEAVRLIQAVPVRTSGLGNHRYPDEKVTGTDRT